VQELWQAPIDDGRIDLTVTQNEGPIVFPALAKILERLARGLSVGTPDERRSRLQGEPRRAAFIDQQAQPDHRELAMARRIRQPLGGHPGGPHAKALVVHFHA
jgi:hypothetical protein